MSSGISRRWVLGGAVALATVSGGGVARAAGAGSATGGATAGGGFSVRAAEDAVRRLLPRHHRQLVLRAVDGGADRYRVSGRAGRLVVEGTSPAVLLAGVHAYLRGTAHASVSWNGDGLGRLPRVLPAPAQPIEATANVPYRFAFNDTNEGYTGPHRQWPDWERELDVLAAHGVNAVLVTLGADAVYYDTFREFGYGERELLDWIPGPAHQPWWLLQNMASFGGPVSRQLLEARAELAAQVTGRVRELGMVPVLPGYFGTVPDDFAGHHAGSDARVVPQGDWAGFPRPDWLDPRTGAFRDVAAAFYRRQHERVGDSALYKMDLLHEGGQAGDVVVGDAARAVETALRRARPDAAWAILGWQSNPRRDILDAVDKTRMLIVDGLSDRYATVQDRERDWGGTPYAYGSIWNFGGHTAIGANLPDWVETYPKWLHKDGSSLRGVAAMPEGADNNPAALALLTDLAWGSGEIALDDWFDAYAAARYGGADPHARAAWRALRSTAYGMRRTDSWSEPPDGLFAARPDLAADKAAAWSPAAERYDVVAFDRVLDELVRVGGELRGGSAYRHDAVDVARQVLSNRSRALLPLIKSAYDAGDRPLFRELTGTWLDWMRLLDRLLGASPQHLLGRWLAEARAWGADRAERDRLEYDARSILTTWGTRDGSESGLHDYANREWAGLVGSLYAGRWQRYFDALDAALADAVAPERIDWFAYEDAWAHGHETHPAEPKGDAHRLAEEVRDTLARSPHQIALHAEADHAAVEAGQPVTVTVSFTNRNGFAAAGDVTLSLDVPDGFTVRALGPVTARSVASGDIFTARFEAALGGGPVTGLVARLTARAAYTAGRGRARALTALRLLAAAPVTAPYATFTTNGAVFGQQGDAFAIEGGGADLWGGTSEYAAVYRGGAYGTGSGAAVRVDVQDATGGWARAGLVVRNDQSSAASAGAVNLAVTPANGVVLSWDANGDGRFDTYASAGSVTAPVRLRLRREGETYVGEYSGDGQTWTAVGTARPAGAAAAQDVGVFMTAANGGSGRRGIAAFSGFEVTGV
ncbi:alpha-N-acetylglucosaminidase TIM-barrel domain-containing protein [Streptomyces sp. NPDC050095]|uniref:alpha-N-acetylglucosaminidase n=1 Tax=unclassified Streptomyces TaxID=2593676 RepID=UPI003430A0D0